MKQKRILLLGGGHSHALLLHDWQKRSPRADYETVLISENEEILYTGMLPGWLAGHYDREELTISPKELCRKAGVVFRRERVRAIDPDARTVQTDKGKWSYDFISLNLGIHCRLPDGLAKNEHNIPLKPAGDLPRLTKKFLELCEQDKLLFTVAVVGGGAGGVEVACALAWRLRRQLNISFKLVCRSFLPEYAPKAHTPVREGLKIAGVDLMEGFDVCGRSPGKLTNSRGEETDARYVFWSTPGIPPAFLKTKGLELDANGFLRVDPFLRSVSHPNIFGAGDVVSLSPQPVAKAGVFAVREAPFLAENLRRVAEGRPDLKAYCPQKDFLTILSLGEKRAVAQKWNRVLCGKMVWHWKDHLDRSFVRKFQKS